MLGAKGGDQGAGGLSSSLWVDPLVLSELAAVVEAGTMCLLSWSDGAVLCDLCSYGDLGLGGFQL